MHLVRTIGIGLVLAAGLAGAVSAQPVGTSSHGGGHNGPGWNNGPSWNRPGWNGHGRPDWRRGDFAGEAGAAAIDNYYNNCNPEAEYCGGRRVTPTYRDRPMSPPRGGYSAQSGGW
ncbi:hypothetical protein [Flaviflagellibacter deserti]|uniref:Uncharacterized protein n=1 Tax=Flaviflagellibacter deserti TaxID=2267266 RepID=A0ABV9Z654_9HYPH